jgi:hypothetical protein
VFCLVISESCNAYGDSRGILKILFGRISGFKVLLILTRRKRVSV